MFYLPEQDCIFVHIPRNGGKSFKTFLENYGTNTDIEIFDKHSPVSTACHYLDNPDALFKCSIVRNPYDREVSIWRFAMAGALAGTDMTFGAWIKWRFAGRPKDLSNLLTYLDPVVVTSLWGLFKCPQTYYLVDETGRPRLDFIGCFERYEEIYDMMRKRFHSHYGYLKHVAMQNTTPRTRELNRGAVDWRLMYDQCEDTKRSLELVYNFYRIDFETFGYPKDYLVEDHSPSRFIGEFAKPSSDPYEEMIKEWPLFQQYGKTGLPLLHDSLSYRFMPEGSNRSVYLKNTSKIKVNDVVMRDDS